MGARNRWGGKLNIHVDGQVLGNKWAKNLCKRIVLLQLIIENVVTCFLEHSVETKMEKPWLTQKSKSVLRFEKDNHKIHHPVQKGTEMTFQPSIHLDEARLLIASQSLILAISHDFQYSVQRRRQHCSTWKCLTCDYDKISKVVRPLSLHLPTLNSVDSSIREILKRV